MRIISQNRTEDIPYEISRLYISSVHTGTIYAELAGMSDATLLGDYYTQEDAIKALEEVSTNYYCGKEFFVMPSAEKIAKKRLNREEKSNS